MAIKGSIKWIVLLAGWLSVAFPSALAAAACPAPEHLLTGKHQRRGAANLDELSSALFAAIKSNNFTQLSTFFPAQAELELLQKGRDKNLQVIAEKLTPEQVQSSFKADFDNLMRASADRMLNWSELTLAETSPNRLRAAQELLAPVKMYLSGGENQSQHYLLYEAVRIRNRYYLFQHISLEKSS